MQGAVLRRPGNENSRIPHFLYIDEFPDFVCKDTEAIFTLYRKYKVATTITAQNLAQLEGNWPEMKYKDIIIVVYINPFYIDSCAYGISRVTQGFGNGKVCVVKLDVLSYESYGYRVFFVFYAGYHVTPIGKVRRRAVKTQFSAYYR